MFKEILMNIFWEFKYPFGIVEFIVKEDFKFIKWHRKKYAKTL